MSGPLELGVMAGLAWAAVALLAQLLGTRRFGRRVWHAPAAGSARRGIAYALGPSLSPFAKESVRGHLGLWALGGLYHLGIFAAFGCLAMFLAGWTPEADFRSGASSPWELEAVALESPAVLSAGIEAGLAPWSAQAGDAAGIGSASLGDVMAALRARGLLAALGIAALAGALAGLALLVRRAVTPWLRGMSHPDDYASNLLATGFAGLAAFWAVNPALEAPFAAAAMALLFYLPLGKIRHCVFFFATRWQAGVFFGRRGVWPPA